MSKPKAAGGDDLPIMQDDRIHWNGQPVAVVLAETQEQADHAQIADPRRPTKSRARSSRSPRPRRTAASPASFMGEPLKLKIGDAEAALAAAPHKVDVTLHARRATTTTPIEPHAATLAWDGDELIVHDATQAVDA